MKKLTLSILLIFSFVAATKAATPEDTIRITLKEALAEANLNNLEIKKSATEIEQAIADFQQTNAVFLPNVGLSYQYNVSNDPLAAFGFKLQQGIVKQADFSPGLLNNPGNEEHVQFQMKLEQPIINSDAWAGRKAAKYKVEALKYKGKFTRSHIQYLVKRAYYAVQLASEQVNVLETARKSVYSYQKLAENNLEQGYLKEVDMMDVNVRLLEIESQLADATKNQATARAFLSFLLGRNVNELIEPTDELKPIAITSEKDAFDVKMRNDLMGMEQGTFALKKMVQYEKLKFVPRLNGFAMTNFYDQSLTGFGNDSWMVGLSLQWNLFSGYKNIASVKKSKAVLEYSQFQYEEQVKKSNLELDKVQRSVDVNLAKMKTQALAREQAKEALRIRTDRFEVGLEKTADLLAAEASFAEKELAYLNTLYNYNNSVFYLQLLTGK